MTTSGTPSSQILRFQQGTVLFVSLVVLLILSLSALVTTNTALRENRMMAGMRNMQLARMAADSALNEAKVKISYVAMTFGTAQVCVQLACVIRDASSPTNVLDFMQTTNAQAAAIPFQVDFTKLRGADETARLAASPAYVIEDLSASGPVDTTPPAGVSTNHLFRITARGVGNTINAVQVVENVYSVAEQSHQYQ